MNLPAGVWKTTSSALPEQAVALAIPLDCTLDKQQLLSALATALQFPDYFGQNWDAAWDCLSGLDWQGRDSITLLLPLPANQPVEDDDLAVFIDLLAEAAEYWHEQQRQLALLVTTQRNDVPCLANLEPLS